MEEKTLNTQTQEQVPATAAPEVKDSPKADGTFKVFNTEDDYKKELQSIASKAKYELLEKTGEKSVDAIRAKFAELEQVKQKLTDLEKVKAEFESLKSEKEKLSESLLMTKLGIKNELQGDFLTLAKSRIGDSGNLESAMTQTLEKYSYFKGESPLVKIGTEKKSSTVDLDDESVQKLMKKYPHLKF